MISNQDIRGPMARKARVEVEGGLYHVITRGNNRRQIFNAPADYEKFLTLLSRQKRKLPFFLYAYCLMTNHVHLLIERQADAVGRIMQAIASTKSECPGIMTRKGRMVCFLLGSAVVCLSGFVACGQFKYRLNEQSAQDSMKALRSAEKTFAANKTDGKFGTLKELAADGLIDSQLATGMKDGYRFSLVVSGASYKFTAVPVTYDESGSWSFYVDESGVIRGTAANQPATVEDRPVRYQQ